MRRSMQSYVRARAKLRLASETEGVFEEADYSDFERPFRLARLFVAAPHHQAGEMAKRMADLAVDVHGYLTMYVHADRVHVEVHVTMDLPDRSAA